MTAGIPYELVISSVGNVEGYTIPTMVGVTSSFDYPVAIRDKELPGVETFKVEVHELCTVRGEGFGIGYLARPAEDRSRFVGANEWPAKLTEIFAKDHRQDRVHKPLIELDN